jgi:hypothetical protein
LKYYGNPHARAVVDLTAQLWLHIPISFGTVKAEELKRMITASQQCVIRATWNSTKERNSQRPNGLRCGKKHTEKQLAGSLKMGI